MEVGVSAVEQVIVVGGGIGGLAAAVALRQAGIPATVYERMSAVREVGAAVALWPNGVKALGALGLRDALARISLPEERGRIYSWRGRLLSETHMRDVERRFGAPVLVVHRADLQAMLLAAFDPSRVVLDAACTGFRQTANGVTALFADGRTAEGDLLIGADGIHSAVRAQMFGHQRPRYSGYTAWRGIATTETPLGEPGTGFETWGAGARFGAAHITPRRIYWYGTMNAPEGGTDAPEGRKQEILTLFRNWHAPIPEIVAATPEAAILRNDIYDRPPLDRWSLGRVTLLGDAAHATTPNLAQGACQAIEDGVVLARCLRAHPTVAAALAEYEARRLRRANLVITTSWRLGQAGQWASPLLCRLRDAAMRAIPQAAQMRQFAAVIGDEF
jgi:2-polyprenyl-6-methoxyphenol hydroxylase-like FAD-dependent oxidoreductase